MGASPVNAPSKSDAGKTAALSQAGYAQVAALKADTQMSDFIKRVIDKYDCKIENEGGFQGIVPWFSGTTLVQDLAKLEDTLLYAVLSDARKSKPWISYKNSGGITGDTAELGFVGYVQVAAMKDDAQMQKFVKRVCDDMGIKILNKGGFEGMVKFYSGTDNFQSFDRLQEELRSAAKTPRTWAEWADPKADHEERKKAPAKSKGSDGFSLLAMSAAQGFCNDHPCKGVSLLQTPHAPVEQHGLGKTAELTQAGYMQVTKLKNDDEMRDFLLRVVDKYDCKVERIGGLNGIVPWFSGTTSVQSLADVENTLLYAVLSYTKDPWLSYKNSDHVTGDDAQLSFVGYVQTAAMRSDVEMKKFCKRVCDQMKVKIVDEGGFEGMVKYYSGTDNFQSYDKLREEIKAAANAPHSWADWTDPKAKHND